MAKSNKKFITSVVDVEIHERVEAALTQQARRSRGTPGQPAMTDRFRAVMILVTRLRADGVPFATARNSKMNKEVTNWLHEQSHRTPDQRKSRRKKVGPDAVQNILKQIKKITTEDALLSPQDQSHKLHLRRQHKN
jgi:hypothetical protein